MSLGDPPRPSRDIDWTNVEFLTVNATKESEEFHLFVKSPSLADLGVNAKPGDGQKRRLIGGETRALSHMAVRLKSEEAAFRCGRYQPNQARPDLLGIPLSLSAALSLGCLSVRRYFFFLPVSAEC